MKFPIEQKFRLPESFIEKYRNTPPNWGFGGLSEFVYIRTYSRIKEDGKNEMWYETVRRVVEGIFTIQKQHVEDYRLGWNQNKAQKSAQEMYDRIFNFKMLGSGRSLWALGTDIINEKGLTESLYNCSFLSTEKITLETFSKPFVQAMDFLMLGVGVGFDTKGAGKITVKKPKEHRKVFIVPDSREGWIKSLELILDSYVGNDNYDFDYSEIRPAGTPIKTFGGVSGGYEPLEELHNGVRKVLDKNIGKTITITSIADIINMIGKAVVSGNLRRSAELLIGENVDEFLTLKEYESRPERQDWAWASNNSIEAILGMDYSKVAEQTAIRGEPGYLFLENMKKYGRIKETEANYKDFRVSGANPCVEITLEDNEMCVSGETRILTKNGYPKIKDVVGKSISVWNGKEWSNVIPFETGKNKKLLRIYFSDGSHLDCTPTHKFSIETSRNLGKSIHKIVDAKDLKTGDLLEKLRVDSSEVTGIRDENSFEWGFFAGDGYLENGKIKGVVCGDKSKLFELGMKGKQGKYQVKENYKDPVGRVYFSEILEDVDVAKELNDKNLGIPEYFFNLDKKSTLDFIAGWIETDGTIQKNIGSWHYRVYGSYQKMLDLQLLMRRVGINTASVSLASRKGFKTNFGTRNYDLYYLTIPSSECSIIPTRYKIIPKEFISSGFVNNNAHKNSKKIESSKRQRVLSVETIEGNHTTYCFTENKRHMGVFGNVLTHQCNLVEVIPSRHENLEDFLTTIKYAYLFGKTITLLNTNWPETNKVMLRNRRIGLSITGVTQFIAERNINELKIWMENGYDKAKHYDKVFSEWFAVPESIKITTNKPSGTLALVAGVTPGVHFPESKNYIRRIRLAKNSPFVKVLERSFYKIEPAYEDSQRTVVVEFPVSVGEKVRTLNDVSMWEQLELAAFCQEHWADNGVSVTITFKENEKNQIAHALDLYQYRLKAVSFLPKLENSTAYPQMPYEEITSKKYEEMAQSVLPLDFTEMFSVESLGEKYCNNDTCSI